MKWGVGIVHCTFLVLRWNVSMRTRIMALGSVLCTLYFLLMTFVVTSVCWFEIVPNLYLDDMSKLAFHKLMVAFTFVNAIGNYMLTIFTDTSIHRQKSAIKNGQFPKDSEKCEKCKSVQPPRTHHCIICETCILKRDHHCFILTVCIGYFNQKYFVMYCLYMMIGTFYGMILIVMYLKRLYDVTFFGPQTFFFLLFEIIVDIMQKNYPKEKYLFFIILMYASLSAGLMAAGLWFWQLMIIRNGQTTHEANMGITKYSSKSRLANFKEVFGKYWILTLLLPIPLPQVSDGMYKDYTRNTKKKR